MTKYNFRDATGTIVVEIDHEVFAGRTVTPADRVRLSGKLDKEMMDPTKVDVKVLKSSSSLTGGPCATGGRPASGVVMRIFSVLLLLAAGLFLLPPGTGAAGFVGPGVSPTRPVRPTCSMPGMMPPVFWKAISWKKIPRKDRYLFEDESGRVVVEIEHETFGHLTVTRRTKCAWWGMWTGAQAPQ